MCLYKTCEQDKLDYVSTPSRAHPCERFKGHKGPIHVRSLFEWQPSSAFGLGRLKDKTKNHEYGARPVWAHSPSVRLGDGHGAGQSHVDYDEFQRSPDGEYSWNGDI